MKDINEDAIGQEWDRVVIGLQRGLVQFLMPLLVALDARIDKRLVRTVVLTIEAILENRHPASGLLLSELGSYILNPARLQLGRSA